MGEPKNPHLHDFGISGRVLGSHNQLFLIVGEPVVSTMIVKLNRNVIDIPQTPLIVDPSNTTSPANPENESSSIFQKVTIGCCLIFLGWFGYFLVNYWFQLAN